MSETWKEEIELKAGLYRQIPAVDELLLRPALAALCARHGRPLVLEETRRELDEVRQAISRSTVPQAEAVSLDVLEQRIARRIEQALAPSLQPVINATGVVLHTNLGRAPLGTVALAHLQATAAQYSNLEYDLRKRERGRRDVHTSRLLTRLLQAEAAVVVNNCAAAVFLVLNTLAGDGEAIVSRGELIEIGDGFRIPEIMAASGAALCEVGTTNRTRLQDYERAISERSRVLLRVHPSNFKVTGFTERPSLAELADLGRKAGLPVFEDLGAGCLTDLSAFGIFEPEAKASLAGGASLVAFSGDKLLGGPQAGIIAGKKELVERVRRNPLFRALRVDKLTASALEATLHCYLAGKLDEVPALRMIRLTADEIGRRASQFAERLAASLPPGVFQVSVRAGESVIGGGSTPDQHLPTFLISLASRRHSAQHIFAALHSPPSAPPVIARVEDDCLLLDLRTVAPEQEDALLAALENTLR